MTTTPSRSLRARLGALPLLVAGALIGTGCTSLPESPLPGSGDPKPVTVHSCTPVGPLVPSNTNERCGIAVIDAFTSGLMRYGLDGSVRSELAEAVSTRDNQTFRVLIREDAVFHDGTPVTSASFIDAWNYSAYAPNQQLNAPMFSNVVGFEDVNPRDGSAPRATTMRGLRALDERSFEITLAFPMRAVAERFGHRALAPLPRVFFDDPEAYAAAPVGAGPFKVTRQSSSGVRLERFEEYVGSTPAQADVLELRYYGSTDDAYKDLQSGLLDVSADLPTDALAPDALRTQFGSRHVIAPTGTVTTLDFATAQADPELQNRDLRHALSMAIDRETIAEEQFPGTRVPATGWVSPVVPGARPGGCGEYCTFNPERARELYEKSGGLNEQLTLWHNADSDHEQWATAVCRSLRHTLRVNCVTTPVLDQATLRDRIDKGTITGLHRSAWSLQYPSPDNYLSPLYSTGGSANDTRYSNPAFDALVKRAEGTLDRGEQEEMWALAEQILARDMPTIPLFNHVNVAAWSPRVSGVWLNKTGTVELTSVRLAPETPAAVTPAPGTTTSESRTPQTSAPTQ